MKKYVFSALALSLLILSCTKEAIVTEEKKQEPIKTRATHKVFEYIVWEGEVIGAWCHRSNGNCLPTVVVTPGTYDHIEEVEKVILAGVASDIATKFQNDQNIISTYIDPSDVNKVISGVYTVKSTRGYYDSSEIYFHFYNQQNNLQVAYPLKK